MKKNHSRLMAVIVMMVCAAALAGAPERPSTSLTLVDLDGNEIQIPLEDLRAMPQETETDLICVGSHAGYIGIFDYTGVRLSEVLKQASAAADAPQYRKENMYVIFKGTDGYQVLASWAELHQPPNSHRALLALQQEGKALPDSEGAIRLVLAGDKYVGRNVKCLERIEIHCAEGVVLKKKEKETE